MMFSVGFVKDHVRSFREARMKNRRVALARIDGGFIICTKKLSEYGGGSSRYIGEGISHKHKGRVSMASLTLSDESFAHLVAMWRGVLAEEAIAAAREGAEVDDA